MRMNTRSALLMIALLLGSPAAFAEEEGDEQEEAETATTAAEPNDGAAAPARPAPKAYSAPVFRSNSNYRTQSAAPAAAPPAQEDEPQRQEPSRPRRETQPVHREPAAAASASTRGSGGGGGACPPVPRKVRTYKSSDVASYCKEGACRSEATLKHYRYPTVVKIGEIADFMERCDFRADTPCPVPGGYQDEAGRNTMSVYTGVAAGGEYGPGTPQTLVPIVSMSPQYHAFDMSIPFEIDPKMKGRTFMTSYTINSNNPQGYQVSISECEGDFSRRAVVGVQGDFSNYLALATSGLEGQAGAAGTTRYRYALKAGKRYYLNIRRVQKSSLETPTDSVPDADIHPYALARQLSTNHMFNLEFPRLSFMAYPAGNAMELREEGFTALPRFRAPGQAF